VVSCQTSTIGLVIFETSQILVDGFLPQMLRSLNKVSRAGGLGVLMEPVKNIRRPEANLGLVHSRQIDGEILEEAEPAQLVIR
jgi:hypothetical protein